MTAPVLITSPPVTAPIEGMSMDALAGIQSIELEITGTCQLRCTHCCTDSGPQAPAGTMTREDWSRVIADVAELGIPMVQFIGGEPTLSPHLPQFIDEALDTGLEVEVYSNLTHVRPSLWDSFSRKGVCLATSYYSDDRAQHEEITRTRGSLDRTRANIAEAVRRGIPLRAGIVEVIEGQRIEQATAELHRLGIKEIQVDRVRKVGRATQHDTSTPTAAELCGHCFRHRVSVSPDGAVSGCILSRFMVAGNVREQRLAEILCSGRWGEMMAAVPEPRGGACTPADSNDCDPARTPACLPKHFAPAPAPSLGVHA
ncbi:radical SAM/SPASM domain-containing protein [Streptomyces sp. NEAU-S77]|uniref:radical SAM/SPASM domain-containing protein n=1 Tax=Streptomyces sp. NEAU-S77 TaxID=3411033 RepID=UPI003BA35AF8